MKTATIPKYETQQTKKVVTLAGWSTEVMSVTVADSTSTPTTTSTSLPHTLLVFVPGNPGCIGWYAPTLLNALIQQLGPGFAAHGVSYAGHGVLNKDNKNGDDDDNDLVVVQTGNPALAWTLEGQVDHKVAYMDYILQAHYNNNKKNKEDNSKAPTALPKLIFLSHSIGSFMVERLCILRPDLMQATIGVLHLMPFFRYHPTSWADQFLLHTVSSMPQTFIAIGTGVVRAVRRVLSPDQMQQYLMAPTFEDEEGQKIAVDLVVRDPPFVRNFLELGTEEVRDVPEHMDLAATQYITQHCPIHILYAKNDRWAPASQIEDWKALDQKGVVSVLAAESSSSSSANKDNNGNSNTTNNKKKKTHPIYLTYNDNMKHDFPSCDPMVAMALDWCQEAIASILLQEASANGRLPSRL